MKAAIYARYSSDRQRESSISDQVRNCTQHAQREGLDVHSVYKDEAISGAVLARPDYQRMLGDAAAGNFDALLIDDLSRLSRDEIELKRVLRKFTFQGLRVIGVLDGYDSSRKGHKLQASIYGIKNEIYLDDLREKTHSGMKGKAEGGYNCGGRTFGYRNVPIEDPSRKDAYGRQAIAAVRYEIDEAQADIVRQMFLLYADGYSYQWIASELNRKRLPASRGGLWAVSAVKVVLENDMYEGRVSWNRRAWIKHPDTGRRTYKKRPQEEWIVIENTQLRIVPQNIIEAVRHRQQQNKAAYQGQPGRSSAQRYLFSGLMACAECGSNFVLVAANRYGCAMHKTRGTAACSNNSTISRHIIEHCLLRSIKDQLLESSNIEKFKRATMSVIEAHKTPDTAGGIRQQLNTAERVRENLLSAIKQGILTPSTKKALESAESEVAGLKRELSRVEEWKVPGVLPQAVERYQQIVAQLEERLESHIEPAREILKSLIGERIRIHRRGEYLEAEIPNHVPAILAKTLNFRLDSRGCGGGICNESTFVPLIGFGSSFSRQSARESRLHQGAARTSTLRHRRAK